MPLSNYRQAGKSATPCTPVAAAFMRWAHPAATIENAMRQVDFGERTLYTPERYADQRLDI